MTKLFTLLAMLAAITACTPKNDPLTSPDRSILVDFKLSEKGVPTYSIFVNGTEAIQTSQLGILMMTEDFSNDLSLTKTTEITAVTDQYTLFTGKRKDFNYSANAQSFHLKNGNGKSMIIAFQVSNNGVVFRYEFPDKEGVVYTVKDEKTNFHFKAETKAWLQHLAEVNTGWGRTNPSYEEHYSQDIPVGTECPTKAGWAFPALFKAGNTWMLISETGIEKTHCASRLAPNSEHGIYKIGLPMEDEVYTGKGLLSTSTTPWVLPWRIIAMSDHLGDIVESSLGTDLATPNTLKDISWIKPGKASWSWAMLKDESVVYDVQKRFIDYASEMNWEYCLVDADWDQNIGYERIEELSKYAQTKNVGLLLWYNSSGEWNTTEYTPKSQLLTREQRQAEFARIEKMGIKGIKVDFFAGDGQSMMEYYQDLFEDAAQYHLLVNCHGATLPRGLQRTYPNLMTMESIKGFEFITFSQPDADQAPNHCAMMPFTRNVFDPMDFTPMCFTEIPTGVKRVTSNGFELALPVVLTSGINHLVETDEGMRTVPNYIRELLQSFPSSWDETKFIAGYPGKLAVIARKSGDTWYVAGINGENISKELHLNLAALGAELKGIIIEDGASNREFASSKISMHTSDKLNITVQGNGGFLMKVK